MKHDDQNFWNIFFSLLFTLLIVGMVYVLDVQEGGIPTKISLFDAVLLSLATFRLVRLFVYDKITQFVRDLFLKKEFKAVAVTRSKYDSGPLRTLSDLLSCPWCFGVWAAFVLTFFYFLTPYAWFIIFALALSALGTLFQLIANMIGWRAEYLKQKVEAKTGSE